MIMKKAISAAVLFASFAVANVAAASDAGVSLSYGPEGESTGAVDFEQVERRVLKSNKNNKKAKSKKGYYAADYYFSKKKKKAKKAKKTRRPKPNLPTQPPTPPLPDIPKKALDIGLTVLVDAVVSAGLGAALSEPNGPFTVFGPTNDAFLALGEDVIFCLAENPSVMQQILLYHVASGTILAQDLSNGQKIPTLLSGGVLTVDLTNFGVVIEGAVNEATVVSPDNLASNGVIHVIDTVLLPPNIVDLLGVCTQPPTKAPTPPPTMEPTKEPTKAPTPPPTMEPTEEPTKAPTPPPTMEPTKEPTKAPTLAPTTAPRSVVGALGLTFPFAEPGRRKLGVSTPEEYAANLLAVAETEANNPACSIDVAVQERLAPSRCRGEFSDDQIALADACYRFLVRTFDTGGCPVNDVAEELAVGFDTNKYQEELGGPTATTIIVLDDQTLPPSEAPTPVPGIPGLAGQLGLTVLVDAVVAAGLLDILSPPNGPYTVFGPDNAAFEALPPEIVDCLFTTVLGRAALQRILEYHVASGTYLSSDLVDGQTIPTLLVGGELTVDFESLPGNETTVNIVGQVNEATVVSPDNIASNGVIHVIDTVLFPPNIDVLLRVCDPLTPAPTPVATASSSPSGSGSGGGTGEGTIP